MEEVQKNYVTPGHPTAFSGVTKLRHHYQGRYSEKKLKEMLTGLDAYTVKREAKSMSSYNPYYVWHARKLLQIDLIDFTLDKVLVRENDNFKYLFCAIDSFTRFLWVQPMKSKKEQDCVTAYKQIVSEMGKPSQRVLCDRGSEFTSRGFQAILQQHGTRMIFANYKAGTVERVQRSLQSLIYKYIEHNQTQRFINVLPQLVLSYNSRKHRIIGMSPTAAEKTVNQGQVRTNLRAYYATAVKKGYKKKKFFIGDSVRILANRGTFGRGYDNTFTREIFKIVNINTTKPLPTYSISDYSGKEKIEGSFYDRELQKVTGDVFKIEQVLDKKTVHGKKQLFVKWLGFPSSENSWIAANDISTIYDGTSQ